MTELTASYGSTILAFGVVGGLLLLQLIVADVVAMVGGHTPGTSVEESHDAFLFRAVRAHANTNESVAAFLLLGVFAMLVSASPAWVNGLAWTYVIARVGHMAMYYADLRPLRSLCFTVGLVALLGLLVVGLLA